MSIARLLLMMGEQRHGDAALGGTLKIKLASQQAYSTGRCMQHPVTDVTVWFMIVRILGELVCEGLLPSLFGCVWSLGPLSP